MKAAGYELMLADRFPGGATGFLTELFASQGLEFVAFDPG